MKRIIVSMLVGALAAFTGEAQAAVDNSAHDVVVASTTFGVCSSCHIPHKSVGKRLWPAAVGVAAARGEVGNLCAYCHDPLAGVLGPAQQGLVFKDTTPTTHGLQKSAATGIGETLDSTLPYVSSASDYMECTSCHNVHDQNAATGQNAFLQADVDTICARCHVDRQFVNGSASTAQGTWGDNYGFTGSAGHVGNPGSHPVGEDVFTDTSQHDFEGTTAADLDSPINTTAIGVVAYGAQGDYNLGPKLINGGTTWQSGNGIGCVTCHMPHGRDDGTTTANPNPDLLAVNQSEMSGHANGNGDPNNALCEACHRGLVTGAPVVAGIYPNPGAKGYSHPVDNYYNLADAGVTALPADWPAAGTSVNVAGPNIICESCHAPHTLRLANRSNTEVIGTGTNTHILRNAENTICDNCHTGTVANHHPINVAMDGTLFDDDVIGDADAVLTCGDCHSGSGAHNWSAAGAVGLDPDWEPRDNGRGAESEANRVVLNTSKECVDCHLPSGNRFSPTRGTDHVDYQGTAGDASHFLGLPETTLNNWPAASVNTTAVPAGTFVTDVWAGTGGGYSRFDGPNGAVAATSTLVCESCHELEPDKNSASANALLLYPYEEGTDQARSLFCEGCHGPTGAGLAAHPQTAEEVGRATLAGGRGNPALLITAITGYAQNGNRGFAKYPNTDRMNCDTCHQPHNSSSPSGTYILEGSDALPQVTGTPDADVTLYGRSWTGKQYDTNATPLDYQNFCLLCHTSGG